jgi:hypothetical protein
VGGKARGRGCYGLITDRSVGGFGSCLDDRDEYKGNTSERCGAAVDA